MNFGIITVSTVTRVIIRVMIFALSIILIYSSIEFLVILFRSVLNNLAVFDFQSSILDRDHLFISHVQELISAILLITIIIELINSLAEYLKLGSANYVSVITEIALIAIIRHLLALDLEHTDSGTLWGLSSLIVALGIFYLVLKNQLVLNTNKSDNTTKSE
jgi:uncharacterized membrane protein (DUF373 family)